MRSYGGNNGRTSAYSGPDYFRVDRKDGSTSYYGALPAGFNDSNDTRVSRMPAVVNAAVTAWPINRFEDSTGNFIRYRYTRHGGGVPANSATEYVR